MEYRYTENDIKIIDMEMHYDILQFNWNKDTNSFYADAWNLVAIMTDGSVHPEAFPTMKKQFFIYNYRTNGFRRFRYVKDIVGNMGGQSFTEWLFQSEDGIECRIGID
jgi:hypothetical protein